MQTETMQNGHFEEIISQCPCSVVSFPDPPVLRVKEGGILGWADSAFMGKLRN